MILVDIGNTATTVARWEPPAGSGRPEPTAMEITRLDSVPTPAGDASAVSWTRRVTGARRESEPQVLVSVVPALSARLADAWPDLRIVDHCADLGFEIPLPDPAGIGPDRLANVAAAAAMGWRDALVVDAGTATTFDLLREGAFAGGLIAPGMGFAARQLGERAARLEPVALGAVPLEPGRDTAEAMAAGAYHVGVQGVLGVLRNLRARAGDPPTVLTGGLAGLIHEAGKAQDWYRDVLMDTDWTLKGAAVAAAS